MSILDWHTYEEDIPHVEEEIQVDAIETMDESYLDSMVSDAEILSDADESSMESDNSAPTSERYRIPMRRPSGISGMLPRSRDLLIFYIQFSRPQRTRRKPTWMNSTDWMFAK